MNLFDKEKTQKLTMMDSNNTTDNLKNLIQEQSEKLEIVLSTNQELLQQNQKLQEENRRLQIQLYSTQSINRKLSEENDSLRNRSGLMLKERQEKLEEKIVDVQAQNSKLRELVNQSNVDIVQAAIKERDAACNRAAQEKQKAAVVKKNADKEIVKAKRNAKSMIADAKGKVQLWQMIAIGTLILGLVIGWIL